MQREPGQRRMQPRQLKGLIKTGHPFVGAEHPSSELA
jgi:hypothetical protein